MSSERASIVARWIGSAWLVGGLLCLPPVATRLFALAAPHAEDRPPLWIFSLGLCCAALLLRRSRSEGAVRLAAASLPFLVLLAAELGTRAALRATDGPREHLVALARRTYHDGTSFVPHPFLQYTGRPGFRPEGDVVDRGEGFNERGFLGTFPPEEKPPGTLRIACLGGSTTARGYPAVMERELRGRLGDAPRVEVLNFGLARYASVHSTVNFVLNVVDFAPDYVVFHHAWNDHWARDRDAPVRGDGSHFMREFRYPEIPDALAIRASVLYRLAKERFFPTPSWTFLSDALMSDTPLREGPRYRDLSELAPYERNVRTIVELGRARGIVPVLVTQPHTTDPDVPRAYIGEHIDQCNDVLRRLAGEYGEEVLFVDLDRLVTGEHDEFFVDLGHMTPEGIAFKAHAIGEAILAHAGRSG